MSAVNGYEDLLIQVMPQVPGCPRASVLAALQTAGRTFCDRTRAWRAWLPDQNLTVDVRDYALSPADEAEVAEVLEVRWRTAEDIEADADGERVDSLLYSVVRSNGVTTLRFASNKVPAETVAGGLRVRAVLLPLPLAEQVEQTLLQLWSDALVARAIWFLKKMPKRDWTDPAGAVDADREYRRMVNVAIGSVMREGRSAAASWSP
jgi:hypothetical protein